MKSKEALLHDLEACVTSFELELSKNAPSSKTDMFAKALKVKQAKINKLIVPVKWQIRQSFQFSPNETVENACATFNDKLILLDKEKSNGLKTLIESLKKVLLDAVDPSLKSSLENAWKTSQKQNVNEYDYETLDLL